MIWLVALILIGVVLILVILVSSPSHHDLQNLQCEISNIKHQILDANRKLVEELKKHHHDEPSGCATDKPQLDNIYVIKGLDKRLDDLEKVVLCSIEKWGNQIMGQIQDEFQGLKQDIADERVEILAAIQKIIDDANGDDDKITLDQVKELRTKVRGIYTETPGVEVPPVEPPVEPV